MKRTIFITEQQLKDIQKAFPIKKVNAGIMDAVASGDGMGIAEDCDYKIGFENNSPLEYAHVTDGSAAPPDNTIEETVYPTDIDLSSFNQKKQLNPKIWKDGDLPCRMTLLDIADTFIQTLDIDIEPIDVILTGSLAGYNWDDKHSDIDLHIVVDFNEISQDKSLLKDYFDAKKKIWNETHNHLRIHGFPVELYVQDMTEIHVANGIYSLYKDEWIRKPQYDKKAATELNISYIKKTVADYMNIIDELEEQLLMCKKRFDAENIYNSAQKWLKRIKAERKNALAKNEKEYSDGNIIFKTLRRNDYIAKLINIKHRAFDLYYSLNR